MPCFRIDMPGGGYAHVRMAKRRAVPCEFCKSRPSKKLCDGPTGLFGKTCDANVCDTCATHTGPDTDLCPRCKARLDEMEASQ